MSTTPVSQTTGKPILTPTEKAESLKALMTTVIGYEEGDEPYLWLKANRIRHHKSLCNINERELDQAFTWTDKESRTITARLTRADKTVINAVIAWITVEGVDTVNYATDPHALRNLTISLLLYHRLHPPLQSQRNFLCQQVSLHKSRGGFQAMFDI